MRHNTTKSIVTNIKGFEILQPTKAHWDLAPKTIFKENQGFKKQKFAQIGVDMTTQIHVSQVDRNDLARVILADQTCLASVVRIKPG